jgi:ribosomal protein L6, bacterial type
MSRIGKKPVSIPGGVKVAVSGRTVKVEGPKGTLSYEHRPEVIVRVDEAAKEVVVTAPEHKHDDRAAKAYWGTTRALVSNMIKGVKDGYEKKLEVVGVGWTASMAGKNLNLKVGFANIISMPIPAGLNVAVDKQLVTITGPDKHAVGQFAAAVRAKRKPEPYNGKGIKYSDEVIRKKAGKALTK